MIILVGAFHAYMRLVHVGIMCNLTGGKKKSITTSLSHYSSPVAVNGRRQAD